MTGSRRFGEGLGRFGDAADFEDAAVEFLEATAAVEEFLVSPRSVLRFSARTLSSSTILLCPENGRRVSVRPAVRWSSALQPIHCIFSQVLFSQVLFSQVLFSQVLFSQV
jgi:hypothetical protein